MFGLFKKAEKASVPKSAPARANRAQAPKQAQSSVKSKKSPAKKTRVRAARPIQSFEQNFKKSKDENAKVISFQIGIDKDDEDKVCLTDNGILWVESSLVNDRKVLGFEQSAKLANIEISAKQGCSLLQLRSVYAELERAQDRRHIKGKRSSVEGVSQMQIDIMAFLKEAIERGASDIHITTREDVGDLDLRILGDVIRVRELPKETTVAWCTAIYNSMCEQQGSHFREDVHQTAAFAPQFVKRLGLFGARVASGPSKHGPLMVIRLLYDNGGRVPSIEDLGYLPEQVKLLEMMMANTHGLSIFSGETGSGKSTSLVSILTELGRRERERGAKLVDNENEQFIGISIRTIEDPIEYQIDGAVQMPLVVEDRNDDRSISQAWTQTISSVNRQDPDVLMVGEIRDPGSARATIDAASTGAQTWSTFHTSDAIGCMGRLKGLGVDQDRLFNPEIITGLINQNLVQELCPDCSISWDDKKDSLSEIERKKIEKYCDTRYVRFRGPGCDRCGDKKGIIGRLVVAEVIVPNFKFMEVLEKEGAPKAKIYWIKEMGGITKTMALTRRINEGKVDPIAGQATVEPLDKDLVTLSIDNRIKTKETNLKVHQSPEQKQGAYA